MKFCFLNTQGEQTPDTLYRKVNFENSQVLSPLNTTENVYHCVELNDEILGKFTLVIHLDFSEGLAILNIANHDIHSAVYFTQNEKKFLEKFFQ